jgi:hypothetical protein
LRAVRPEPEPGVHVVASRTETQRPALSTAAFRANIAHPACGGPAWKYRFAMRVHLRSRNSSRARAVRSIAAFSDRAAVRILRVCSPFVAFAVTHSVPAPALAAPSPPPPKLGEVRIDSLPPFTNAEYIELVGVAGTSLDGLAIVVLGDDDDILGPALGNSGVVEAAIGLDGHAIPSDRGFLVHASGILLVEPDLAVPTRLEDADNLTVLLVRGAKVAEGDDLDIDDDGVLDAPPWAETIDGVSFVWNAPGSASEWTYATAQVGPLGGMFVFHARRCLDTDAWVAGQMSYAMAGGSDSPGVWNPPCAGSVCSSDPNGDGTRDGADLSLLLLSWGRLGTTADLDGDGEVGAGDLSILLANWGPCDL